MITPKMVKKPWGQEEWISDGIRMPYALKRILFKAGHRSSLQVHEHKRETNYVLDGTGILLIGRTLFPVAQYRMGLLARETLEWYMEDLESIVLSPGGAFDVEPGTIHRVIATTDLTFIEASTSELDDVIRLQDDSRRGHGKIDGEHV